MAHSRAIAANPSHVADPELDRRAALEEYFQTPPQEGAGQVGPAPVQVAVDGQLSRDGRFRWNAVWGCWVPHGKGADEEDLPGPLEWGPLMPEPSHRRGCWCQTCWDAGLRYGEYLKAKKIRENNGF